MTFYQIGSFSIGTQQLKNGFFFHSLIHVDNLKPRFLIKSYYYIVPSPSTVLLGSILVLCMTSDVDVEGAESIRKIQYILWYLQKSWKMFHHKFILPIIPISINHFQKQNNYFFHNWDHANLIVSFLILKDKPEANLYH